MVFCIWWTKNDFRCMKRRRTGRPGGLWSRRCATGPRSSCLNQSLMMRWEETNKSKIKFRKIHSPIQKFCGRIWTIFCLVRSGKGVPDPNYYFDRKKNNIVYAVFLCTQKSCQIRCCLHVLISFETSLWSHIAPLAKSRAEISSSSSKFFISIFISIEYRVSYYTLSLHTKKWWLWAHFYKFLKKPEGEKLAPLFFKR